MIKEIETFEEICGEASPLFPRIFSAFKYKSGSDNAWVQFDENEEKVSLLSSVDGNFTLITTGKTDFEEIKEFMNFFGCNSIISDTPLTSSAKACTLFKFIGNKCEKIEQSFINLNKASSVNDYKNFHSLLFFDSENDFDLWYCDFSKKIVNGDSKAVALKQDENLVSIATAPMIYKNTAIISGVYTLKEHRNNGYSRATIYKLVDELKKDGITDIYLWCEKDVEEFYEKIGFETAGNVYLGVLK